MAYFYTYSRTDKLDFQWPHQLTRQLESFTFWEICLTPSAPVCSSTSLSAHVRPSAQRAHPHPRSQSSYPLVHLSVYYPSPSTRLPVRLFASLSLSALLPVRPPIHPVHPLPLASPPPSASFHPWSFAYKL